jgi:hypothetical protein
VQRAILFKGICQPTGNWVVGLPYDEDRIRVKEDCGDFYAYTTYPIVSETLSEFTGLYDVNHKKIWENDIVKVRDNLGSLTGRVIWSKNHGMYMVGSSGISLGDFDWCDREVVGNYYDKENATK